MFEFTLYNNIIDVCSHWIRLSRNTTIWYLIIVITDDRNDDNGVMGDYGEKKTLSRSAHFDYIQNKQ